MTKDFKQDAERISQKLKGLFYGEKKFKRIITKALQDCQKDTARRILHIFDCLRQNHEDLFDDLEDVVKKEFGI